MRSTRFLAALALAPALFLAADAAPDPSWARGIDVSHHQGTIDWARVRASGRSFAIIRVSDGLQVPDRQFARNWAGAKAAGLVRGVYQYFRPAQNAEAQADLLLSKVGQLEAGDLPPVLDLETMGGMSSSAVSAQVNRWVARVKARTGVTPMIYVSPGFWNGMANRPSIAGIPLWVAHWGASQPRIPAGWSNWAFWQTSDRSRVPGISGNVDEDWFHGTEAQLRAFAASRGASGVAPGGGSTATPTTPRTILRQGAYGSEVRTLQQLLENKGYDTGGVDGIFGPRTRAAVVAFQRDAGLVPDGIVGPLTWGALAR